MAMNRITSMVFNSSSSRCLLPSLHIAKSGVYAQSFGIASTIGIVNSNNKSAFRQSITIPTTNRICNFNGYKDYISNNGYRSTHHIRYYCTLNQENRQQQQKEQDSNKDNQSNSNNNNNNESFKDKFLYYFFYTLQIAGIVFILRVYVVDHIWCRGRSMQPTLLDGEKILIDKRQSSIDNIQIGDLVEFVSPTDPKYTVCKRIRFVEGDVVRYQLFDQVRTVKIPPGYVWVEGDNQEVSFDSKRYGPIPRRLILGKVVLIWYPRIKFISDLPIPPTESIKLLNINDKIKEFEVDNQQQHHSQNDEE